MVDRVIQTMGATWKILIPTKEGPMKPLPTGFPGFTRDTSNKILAGVCAGIGNRFDIDPLWVRLASWSPYPGGAGFLIYLIPDTGACFR